MEADHSVYVHVLCLRSSNYLNASTVILTIPHAIALYNVLVIYVHGDAGEIYLF